MSSSSLTLSTLTPPSSSPSSSDAQWRPATSPDSLLPSLNLIAAVGAVGHSDDAAALTPDVYWWHHGRLERLTTVHDGRIRVDATGEFGKVLEQVGGEPPTEPA